MQALFPYSPTLSCLAVLYPTFGKRAQSTLTSAPESGVGASEDVSTSAGDKISLNDVIAKLKAAGNEDTRAEEILAAVTTLRDSSGRDRKDSIRKMANAWGVTLNEKVDGKYKPRGNSALAEDIEASVCKAALDWESQAESSQCSDTRSPSRADAEAVLKKARTAGAAERGAAVTTRARDNVRQLPETPDDFLSNTLSRLGPNMYQGTLRSGMIWRGDAELLRSMPQGEARLATLQTRERVAQAKAKATVKAKAVEEPPRDQEDPAESSASRRSGGEHGEAGAADYGGGAELHGASSKRQRTLRQMFVSSGSRQDEGEHGQAPASQHGEGAHDEAGAPQYNGGERVGSGVAEHCDGIEVHEHPATTSTELFVHDRDEDRVLLDWLRERPEHGRCSVLLQQIMEWTGKCQTEMRSLAKALGNTIRRQDRANLQQLRETARRHFKAAVGQEKQRLAYFGTRGRARP